MVEFVDARYTVLPGLLLRPVIDLFFDGKALLPVAVFGSLFEHRRFVIVPVNASVVEMGVPQFMVEGADEVMPLQGATQHYAVLSRVASIIWTEVFV